MTRKDSLTTEEGVKFLISNWTDFLAYGNEALSHLNKLNEELTSYFNDHIPLSSNSVARYGGLRQVNNSMGIYTNDLHKHIKSLNSGAEPSYPPDYVSKLRAIDKDAQEWKIKYNEALNTYKIAKELYFLSLHNSDGTFDIGKWI